MSTDQEMPIEESVRPLFSRQAEDAVIAACLINPDMFAPARAIIAPTEFFIEKDRWIWAAMDQLAARHEPIDLTTVGCELGEERLKEVGGQAYLIGLTNLLGSSLNAEAYARTAHDLAMRRKLVSAARDMTMQAYRDDVSTEEVIARSYLGLHEASLGLTRGGACSLREALSQWERQVEETAASGGGPPGIATGFATLDGILGGGIGPGQLALVTAFPGGGKSSFLLNVALHAGTRHRILLFSLEMSPRDIAQRMLALHTGINSQMIRGNRLEPEERNRVKAAVEELGELQLEIHDTRPLSVPVLRSSLIQAMAQDRVDLVMIDYAGLMHSPGDTEYEQQRALSGDLKELAGDLNLPLLVALQLNRRGHDADAPQAHHLRGSGTWEQDADIVMVLQTTDEPRRRDGLPYRLRIVKQRNGPTGCVNLLFKPETMRFEET